MNKGFLVESFTSPILQILFNTMAVVILVRGILANSIPSNELAFVITLVTISFASYIMMRRKK